MITSELIAVGSELLTPYRQDTNTLWLTERLNAKGIAVQRKQIIGDDREALAALFQAAGKRSSIVIACGGLGPTFDDVTREALADALSLKLVYNEEIFEAICERYRKRGLTPTENNKRQAMVPEGGLYFPNAVGTAPGLLVRTDECVYALVPGPPPELEFVFPTMENELFAGLDTKPVFTKKFKLVGIPESAVDHKMQGFPLPNGMELTILAAYGQVEIHFRIRSEVPTEAERAFAAAEKPLRDLFGNFIFGTDEDSLESVVGDLLRKHGHTLALAESCTGGWLAQRITDIPGSSDYFLESFVTYSNEAKMRLLGVSEKTLIEHGAVSRQTVLEMARGARERSGADVSAAVSGIAGPGGGTPDKPVGTVYIGVISSEGKEKCHRFLFPGNREKIRFQATQLALAMIRSSYLGKNFKTHYIVPETTN